MSREGSEGTPYLGTSLTEKSHHDRHGRLMMICTYAGKIVFVHGDQTVLQIKNQQLLQRNLFQIGFTQFSLYPLRKHFPKGFIEQMIAKDTPLRLRMELVRRGGMGQDSEERWNANKLDLIKVIGLSCSYLKVAFNDHPITVNYSEVVRSVETESLQTTAMEESLILLEVQAMKETNIICSHFKDYCYTCRSIQKQENSTSMDLE